MTAPLPQSEWRKVREWTDEHLAYCQKLLENPALGVEATALQRGSILMLRQLIAWGEPEIVSITPVEPQEY